jgi:membrane protein
MSEPAKPGILDRLRARYGWFDHAMRANDRYDDSKGNFFAAGLTYYTIFALFPLLMVGFSAGGFLLSRRPDVLIGIDHKVRAAVPGALGQQVVDLMNSAIASRASVGIIGLAAAAWVGLNWMGNLRVALSAMWQQHDGSGGYSGYIRTKLSDLTAMVSSFVAIVVMLAISLFATLAPMARVLARMGIHNAPVLDAILRTASFLVSILVSWFVFSWMIARLPRQPVSLADSIRAALLAAVAFELFKVGASIYLKSVLHSPAGAAFGPVLGLMVFAYITARLLLFASAWAATTHRNPTATPVTPPEPVTIAPRVQVTEGFKTRELLAAAAVGAVGALGLSRLTRRTRQ